MKHAFGHHTMLLVSISNNDLFFSSGTHTTLGARSLICQTFEFGFLLFFPVKAYMRSEEVQISERNHPQHI